MYNFINESKTDARALTHSIEQHFHVWKCQLIYLLLQLLCNGMIFNDFMNREIKSSQDTNQTINNNDRSMEETKKIRRRSYAESFKILCNGALCQQMMNKK